MARTAITPTVLGRNTFTEIPAGTDIDATNGMSVPYVEQDQLNLTFVNTDDAAITVTIKAATDNPFAYMRGQGDLAKEIAVGKTWKAAGLEQMRFKQLDGSMYIDFSAGAAGTVSAEITL